MRSQIEATGDEYNEFSPGWYSWAKSKEPEFDNIVEEVVLKL